MKFEGNYIQIPRFILERLETDLLRIPIFIYLYRKVSLDDTIGCCLDDIIYNVGYSNIKIKTNIINRINTTLSYFQDNGLIEIDNNYNKLSQNYYVRLYPNKDYFDAPDSFCQILLSEVDKILNYKDYITLDKNERNVMPDKLLYILTYIRMNKLRRADNQEAYPNRKPEFFFKQIKDIAEDLEINKKTVSSGIVILEKLNIIVSKKMKRYKDVKGNWHTGITLFVDKYDGWEQELEWGVSLLNSGKKIIYKQ
ncbi:hypothetical protein [Anaerovorax sp. IOR16]|uniref:hypothetical protein n=1 Tax=Anaerovorax sp. IOR16 TaxID=2773458 RepID=UPI0019CF82CA|nr:hypothetical protein [Anaerovorax sp. IOR16]